ncbi:hypothetical protein PFISCL1PPCAC_15676 [Pristionchus fissidentatus]|uniref:Sm domain-containing protein n=1 Tax=Pristionchus fissidentatus TaxID=1538716 RepID=A0AAV5VXP0_9BILA|nr:hypothetical protein PFISCL1PPCAC_15676 [Pristionchus fissidentatus]
MDDVFLSADFDPEATLKGGISPGFCDESLERFEKFLHEEDDGLAKLIFESKEESHETKKLLSKKEQKRGRELRLKEMVGQREIFEQRGRRNNDTILEKMNKMDGPLAALASAVTNGNRIEVRLRSVNRIDRVMRGLPVAFDKHWNIVLKEVQDCQKPSKTQGGLHLLHRSILPPFAQWIKPDPPFNQYRRRNLPCTFIKGDTVCMIRLL